MQSMSKYLLIIRQETVFQFVRDYETVKVEQEVPNEFLLVLQDADAEDDEFPADLDKVSTRKQKGAYYKNIERKMLLKKKRANVRFRISLSHSSTDSDSNFS
jgi:RNA polymerase II-associated factor 1